MNTQTKEQDCINWKNDIQEWSLTDSEVVLITESKLYYLDFDEAKVNELNKWKQHNVFEKAENQGQSAISTRWVCRERNDWWTGGLRKIAPVSEKIHQHAIKEVYELH